MRRLALLSIALLVTAAISGCAATSKTDSSSSSVPTDIQEVKVNDDTGAIRGIVVTDSITPIVGANVTIKVAGKDVSKKTSTSGGFVFDSLKPGTYFVTASKLGYKTVQASATVVAGDASPAVTKIILPTDLSSLPYAQLTSWKGFLQCAVGVAGVGSVNPCAVFALTGTGPSDNVHNFAFPAGVPTFVQGEAVWKGNQPLGAFLSFGWYKPGSGTANFQAKDGSSPLVLRTEKAAIDANQGLNSTLITARMFAGGGSGASIITNQDFTVFVTMFYAFKPKDTWAFNIDGECTSPDQCA